MRFERVYDYVPGKADWSASGLPTEGAQAGNPTIGEAARRDVPTCAPAEKVGTSRRRLGESSFDRCVVVSKQGIVLGLLREKEQLATDPTATAGEAMRNGPATFRPDEPVEKMAKRMRDRGASAVLVTTPDGRLVGLLYRADAEHAVGLGA